MNKLKQGIKKLIDKIKELSKGKKIVLGILTVGVIAAIISLVIYFNRVNYAVLFRDMDPNDAQTVLTKLNEKKIEYKIENNTIKVPEKDAPELRMEMAPTLTGGSKGYEILDEGSKWGMTDKEMSTKYQIALQGELKKTIETFPEVEKADVKLVMQEESNFFKDEDPAQASVTLHFKNGKKINKEQIKAIVSLLTGSVKNLSKENVKVIGVINGTTSVLSEDLFTDNSTDIETATEKQRQYEKNIEKEYEKKITKLLEPKYGEGVKASVDIEANFDASEKNSVVWDKKPVIRSEKNVKDTESNNGDNESRSPVDNNMTNETTNENGKNVVTSHEESTKNYEVGKVEEKVVAAPGKVKKVSASIIIDDDDLSDEDKAKVRNTVSAAIGYNQTRGDMISVEGMRFNGNDISNEAKEQEAKEKEDEKNMLMYKYIGAGVGTLILLILIIVLIKKRRKIRAEEEEENGIDEVIDDNLIPKEPLKPIEFDKENEKTHLEKEIKRYAKDKPEQVAEIIKSWMAEDER